MSEIPQSNSAELIAPHEQIVSIGRKEFVETRPLPDSTCPGFPDGFGSVLTPADGRRFDFDNWSFDIFSILMHVRRRGAVVFSGADIEDPGQLRWKRVPGAFDRAFNTDPHIEDERKHILLCLAHKQSEQPRAIDTCVCPLGPLVNAMRAQLPFQPLLQSFSSSPHPSEFVGRLGARELVKSDSEITDKVGYLRCINNIFRAAAPWTLRYSGVRYPGSVLIIDDAAFCAGREPIVHWKDNPRKIEELTNPMAGGVLWRRVISLK